MANPSLNQKIKQAMQNTASIISSIEPYLTQLDEDGLGEVVNHINKKISNLKSDKINIGETIKVAYGKGNKPTEMHVYGKTEDGVLLKKLDGSSFGRADSKLFLFDKIIY